MSIKPLPASGLEPNRVQGFLHPRGRVRSLVFLYLFFFSTSTFTCLFTSPLLAQVQWGPDVRLTYAPGSAFGPELAVWKDTIYVVWWDTRPIGGNNSEEVYFKSSTDGGSSWSSDLKLSLADSGAEVPDIVAHHNTVHVVWHDYRKLGYTVVYYRRSLDAGVTWGSEVPLSSLNNRSSGPALALGDSQDVYAVWVRDNALRLRKSTDGGANWQRDTTITDTIGGSGNPCMVYAQGVLHIVNNRLYGSSMEAAYLRSTDRGTTWSPRIPLSEVDTIPSQWPRLAADSFGRVHVAWMDYKYSPYPWTGDIFNRRSTDKGLVWEPIREENGTHRAYAWNDVACSGNRVYVVWEDERMAPTQNSEVYFRMSTDRGVNWRPEERLTFSSGKSAFPRVVGWDSLVHVLWSDERDDTSGHTKELYYKRGMISLGVEQETERGGVREPSFLRVSQNPCFGGAWLEFWVPQKGNFSLILYDVAGREVRNLMGKMQRSGRNRVFWDARDGRGERVAAGVYLVKYSEGSRCSIQKVVLLR